MAVSEPAAAAVCAGLEQIRLAERLRTSRALHDQIGPSLCSAGLMIGLLRSSPGDDPETAGKLMETIQDALEAAIDAVRALSYSADPALARRCGMRGALEFLAGAHKAELDARCGVPSWPKPRAEAACRILQDALLLIESGGTARRLESTAACLRLYGAGALAAEARAALASAAGAAGLRLAWHGEGEASRLELTAEETS